MIHCHFYCFDVGIYAVHTELRVMEVSKLGRSISSILDSGSHLHSEKERQGKIPGIAAIAKIPVKDVTDAFCFFNWSPLEVLLSFMGTSDLFCKSEVMFVVTVER